MSDPVCREEFEDFKGHVDDQHVGLFNKLADTEVAIMERSTKTYRWILGIFITVLAISLSTFSSFRTHDLNEIHENTNGNKALVQQSLEQSLVNSKEIEKTLIVIGAGLDKSSNEDKAILDKIEAVDEKNQIQIQYLEKRLERKHPD